MENIMTIDLKNYNENMVTYEKYAARGIINMNGKLAMQKSNILEYKIPGGQIERGESPIDALIREIKEEVGLVVKEDTIKEIGEVVEIRKDALSHYTKYVCHSYYYYCNVEDYTVETKMTASEKRHGYKLEWATIDEIISQNEKLICEDWRSRDTEFLKWLRSSNIRL